MIDILARDHYPIALSRIPATWSVAFVGDVCSDVQSGFASGEHNSIADGVPHVRPMNISRDGDLDLSVLKSVAPEVDARRLSVGDVLFNNTNSPVLVGKTAAVAIESDMAFSNHMTRLRPSPGIDYRFLARQLYYLWTSGYFRVRCTNHVNQASVSAATLAASVPVVIPPANEQSRIVETVDALLSRLDAAVASLQAAQRKLKAYRASVLKSAVEGRLVSTEAEIARKQGRSYEPAGVLLERILTERRRLWEEAELAKMKAAGRTPRDDRWKANYEEPEPPETATLPGLPEGWCWASAGAICEGVESGTTPSKQHFADVGTPFIKVYNLTVNGRLDFTVNPTFVDADYERARMRRSRTLPGDILTNIVGPPLGKVSEVPETHAVWNINQAIARFRALPGFLASYLKAYLQSSASQRWLLRTAKTTTSQVNLSITNCRRLPVPIPPLVEQSRIVDVLEETLSIATSAARQIEIDIRRCSRLRQAVLASAFAGRLVDQDSAEEPADVLLARIRAERASAAQSSPKRKRPRRVKAAS